MEQWQIRVTGLVQGVFFRRSAREVGDRLGIGMTATNLADGSVLIEAEGDPAALDQLRAWCETGPPKARVESVTVEVVRGD